MIKVALIFLLYGYQSPIWASNQLREMEYAEEIEASFSVGNVAWLETKNKAFLTLYTETEESENIGTAIILHPMDGHPDQKKVINPLRTYLPEHDWATLSIQLPVLGFGAKEQDYYSVFEEAKVRIQTSIDFLVASKVKNIILIGYGLGGMMAVNFIKDSSDVDAIVTISLPVPDSENPEVQMLDFLGEIKYPFLDIYAEFDLPEVTDSARKRRIAGKVSLVYRQFEIKGEGHLFQHDEGLLVKRIYSWINRTFKK